MDWVAALVFQPGAMVRLGGHVWEGVVPTLRAEAHGGDNEPYVLIVDATRTGDCRIYDDEITPCLKSRMGTGGGNVPLVAMENQVFSNSSFGSYVDCEVAGSLRTNANESHIVVSAQNFDDYNLSVGDSVHHALRTGGKDRTGVVMTHEVVGSLQARSYKGPNHENARDGHLVVMDEAIAIQGTVINRQDQNGPRGIGAREQGEPMYSLDTMSRHAVAHKMIVRRLTVIECERLMGWPDNHTLPRADGKTNADSNRYKMCGNGVASPVAQWIAESITRWENDEQ